MNKLLDRIMLRIVFELLNKLRKRVDNPKSWAYCSMAARLISQAENDAVAARRYIKNW